MLYVLGITICVAVLLQMGMWISLSIRQHGRVREQFDINKKLIENQIAEAIDRRRRERVLIDSGNWNGFREFVVERMVREAKNVTSVYLKPTDGKPIAAFKPGQHLPCRFHLPGERKPIVRCYSLSQSSNEEYYRITVKAVGPAIESPESPPGKISNFINRQLTAGDIVEAKSPSGSFFLDESGQAPVILLAGGIGVTPMTSMIDHLVRTRSDRLIVLFYGVRCGEEHSFKNYFARISNEHANIHVVNCYSDPTADDQLNRDYHVQGYVTVDLLKQLLPDKQCEFFLCGPPPFMESLVSGLRAWGVTDNRIQFEAFGPATIKKATEDLGSQVEIQPGYQVCFRDSNKKTSWDPEMDSILELAEANNIDVESGCRAGSCGTCATRLLKGKVNYPAGVHPECEQGSCLACIAKPAGDIDLDV